jgi:hypothetical protein
MQLNKLIAVKTTLAKSINLDRDKSAKELLESYVLTSTAMQNIQNIINSFKCLLILVATLAFSMRNFLHANLPSVAFGLLSK